MNLSGAWEAVAGVGAVAVLVGASWNLQRGVETVVDERTKNAVSDEQSTERGP